MAISDRGYFLQSDVKLRSRTIESDENAPDLQARMGWRKLAVDLVIPDAARNLQRWRLRRCLFSKCLHGLRKTQCLTLDWPCFHSWCHFDTVYGLLDADDIKTDLRFWMRHVTMHHEQNHWRVCATCHVHYSIAIQHLYAPDGLLFGADLSCGLALGWRARRSLHWQYFVALHIWLHFHLDLNRRFWFPVLCAHRHTQILC